MVFRPDHRKNSRLRKGKQNSESLGDHFIFKCEDLCVCVCVCVCVCEGTFEFVYFSEKVK